MKYSICLKQYMCKSPYPYYVVKSDIELTKFEVWGFQKLFNATLYTEQQVLDLIQLKYPDAERIKRNSRPRKKI